MQYREQILGNQFPRHRHRPRSRCWSKGEFLKTVEILQVFKRDVSIGLLLVSLDLA
jgi:hypothetical protein